MIKQLLFFASQAAFGWVLCYIAFKTRCSTAAYIGGTLGFILAVLAANEEFYKHKGPQ